MILRLDPRIPIVWRDPTSMQFGIDPARVVLHDVSTASERMIAALTTGVSRSGLSMIGRSAGADDREIDGLVAAIQPALAPRHDASAAHSVAVVGTGVTVERIAKALSDAALTVHVSATTETARESDLGIVIASYVLDPVAYGFWLRRDTPHLPVVFSDTGVRVGPFIEPGRGPCLYCLDRYRTEADPAWPAIASQLWQRRSPAETPLVSAEVSAIVVRLAVRRFTEGASAATSIHLDGATGAISRFAASPHPECGCIKPH